MSNTDNGPVVPNMTYVLQSTERDEEVAVKIYRRNRRGQESVVGLMPDLTLLLKTYLGEVIDVSALTRSETSDSTN